MVFSFEFSVVRRGDEHNVYENPDQEEWMEAEVELSKKDIKEIGATIVENNGSIETRCLPRPIYMKFHYAALEVTEDPDYQGPTVGYDDQDILLQQYLPVALLDVLPAKVRKLIGHEVKAVEPEQPVAEVTPVEHEEPNKANTLYLPIKQIYFDQIIAGTKRDEYREVKKSTAARLLYKDEEGYYYLDGNHTKEGETYYIDDYNNGHFPYVPKPFKYLHLAVGYAKVRDEAIVEITGITMIPENLGGGIATWIIDYHLGKIVKLERQKKHD